MTDSPNNELGLGQCQNRSQARTPQKSQFFGKCAQYPHKKRSIDWKESDRSGNVRAGPIGELFRRLDAIYDNARGRWAARSRKETG
jgi:hypothetical protein